MGEAKREGFPDMGGRGALPGSNRLSDGAGGTFPGRWPTYIGLITPNLEISPRSPTTPSSLPISSAQAFIPTFLFVL